MTRLAALVLVAAVACGTQPQAPSNDATLAGHVTSAPSCPVERAGTPCPPRAVSGALVELRSGDRVVVSTRTDTTGAYVLHAAAGTYVVRATNTGGLATTAERDVRLDAGTTTTADLVVDSGIR